jgi:Lipase (class 3)
MNAVCKTLNAKLINAKTRIHAKNSMCLSKNLVFAITLFSTTNVFAGPAEAKPSKLEAYSPIVVLSDRVGDVGQEAIGSGVPVLRGLPVAASIADVPDIKIFYADVDSIQPGKYREVVDMLGSALARGEWVCLETSNFDFPKLRKFIATEFPQIDTSNFNDVAVFLRPNGKLIEAERIDPSDLAMYAGVPLEKTAAYIQRQEFGAEEGIALEKSTSPLPVAKATVTLLSAYKPYLELAQNVYDASPSKLGYALEYNGTYVDVWSTASAPGRPRECVAAWRGTVITHMPDVQADLSSQFSYSAVDIPGVPGGQGGKGFVNRFSAYSAVVMNTFARADCFTVSVTGHSLGGAVASIQAIRLAHHADWKYALKDVVIWNSPNVVTAATLGAPLTTLKLYANHVGVMCRYHDWLVNPLPSGLWRIGPSTSSPTKGCTHVAKGAWSLSATANHNASLWDQDYRNGNVYSCGTNCD